MEKFRKFIEYIKVENEDELEFSFEEIESILGFHLSSSAYKYKQYWSPSETHTFPLQILQVGYEVIPDLENKRIKLVKVGK